MRQIRPETFIAVVGSRQFTGVSIQWIIEDFLKSHPTYPLITVCSGGARGVDSEAETAARSLGLPFIEYPALWDIHLKQAGIRRNILMADDCDEVFAIWDGVSPGTKHMIDISRKKGKKVTVKEFVV